MLVATNKSVTGRGSKSTNKKSRPRIEVVLERPHKCKCVCVCVCVEELLNVSVEFAEGQPQPSSVCEVNVPKGGACKQPTRGDHYQLKVCVFSIFFLFL